jgi:hypothetical protein
MPRNPAHLMTRVRYATGINELGSGNRLPAQPQTMHASIWQEANGMQDPQPWAPAAMAAINKAAMVASLGAADHAFLRILAGCMR